MLTPELIGATKTTNAGIIGEGADLNLDHTKEMRLATLAYHLTGRLLMRHWRKDDGDPKLHLFGQLNSITTRWLKTSFRPKAGINPAQLLYQELADLACKRIMDGITAALAGEKKPQVVLDPYNPIGSTSHVRFTTTKTTRWKTDSRLCHINWVILDSGWEGEFCRVVEGHSQVRAYVKNRGLGLEIPYQAGSTPRTYIPDFIVLVEDGHGEDDLLNLIVEIKGYRHEDAKDKKLTMETHWIPGVNQDGRLGRWAFAELKDVHEMEEDFEAKIASVVERIMTAATPAAV